MHFLTHNLITVLWFRCVIVENFIIKSTDYMKDDKFFNMIKRLHMKNYYLNMALFLYIIKKTAKKLLQKIKKLPRLISQNYFKFRIFITYEKVLISEFSNLTKSYVSYLGPKIWSQVPQEVKFLESFRSFKRAIKKWVPGTCQSL